MTIQDNWFGCPVSWLTDPGGETACDGQADIQFNSVAPFSGWLIRHNSFGGGLGEYVDGASFDDFRVVGNAGSAPSHCYHGMTFAYNAWETSTVLEHRPAARGSPVRLVEPRLGGLPPLVTRREPAPSSNPDSTDAGPSADMLGQLRPLRFPSDAGALQPDTALIVPGHSIGSAVIGVPSERLAAIYGDPVRTRSVKLGPDRVVAQAQLFKAPGGRLGAFVVDDKVVGLWTTSPFYSSPTGLGCRHAARGREAPAPLRVGAVCRRHAEPNSARSATSFLSGAGARTVNQVLLLRRQFVMPCGP